MKVTFLIPPVLDGTSDVDRCFGCNYSIYFLPLLPVLYAATILKQSSLEVSIEDFPARRKNPDDFKEFIRKDNSQIYIFYTVFLCQETDMRARNFIREVHPQARFIFSGPQGTYSPEVFLDREDTIAVRGEPEFIIREAVLALQNNFGLEGIKGISYLKSGQLISNPAADFIAEIDQIPLPDRTLLDHSFYSNPKLSSFPHTAALTSRGCFGQCWYCVPNSLSYARELEHKKCQGRKPPARLHSPARVIAEFKQIAALGFKSVSIIDDEFLWNEARTIEICDGIKPLGLEWSCLSRPEMVTDLSAKAMKEAGCAYVDMGTESFDPEVLKAIRKEMSPEDTVRAVKTLKKYKIEVELNVLFGATPKETVETIKNTLREVKKLQVDYCLFSIANPFPGTDFYSAAKKEGWLYYGDYVPVDSAKQSIITYPHLTKEKLEKIISYAYFSFYFDPRYLFRQLLRIRSFADLRSKINTAFTFFYKNFFKK